MCTNGDCVRGLALVREAVQRIVQCSGGMVKKPDARLERLSRIPCDCTGERVIEVVHFSPRIDLLREEKKPIQWRNRHVAAERGVNCVLADPATYGILDNTCSRLC